MKSLKECYKKLLNNTQEWSYYDNPPYLKMDTMYDSKESLKFIKEYFKCGRKGTLFDNLDAQSDEILMKKSQHIISTYLLGIIIYKSLKRHIEKNQNIDDNFKYLWFLSCLYHDIGYIYEEELNCKNLRTLQADGIEGLKKFCNIEYLYTGKFKPYTKEHINVYLSERARCRDGCTGVIDHGIIGGFLLYDRLRKNYETAWNKVKQRKIKVTRKSFEYGGLLFSEEHFDYYEKAAQAIIVHNIWRNTLKKYLAEKDEENAGIEDIKKISIVNPIAYILALADTLEPIKKYGIDSLANTYYGEETNGFIYSFGKCGKKSMVECINDLKNWVDVEIEDQSGSGIWINEGRKDDEFHRIILRKLNN